MSADPYGELRRVLVAAHDQAANGKGRERHAGHARDSAPIAWDRQPILTNARELEGQVRRAGLAGIVYQARKKAGEAVGKSPGAARHELLGAIVYLAAAVVLAEELEHEETLEAAAAAGHVSREGES